MCWTHPCVYSPHLIPLQLLVAQSAVNMQAVIFEATSVSAHILVKQQSYHSAKGLLRGRLESSSLYPYWHIRLLLQLADICMSERDERGVANALNKCADYAKQVDAPYTRSAGGFFLLIMNIVMNMYLSPPPPPSSSSFCRLLCNLCKGAVSAFY